MKKKTHTVVKAPTLYTWNWLGGGYNSCTAATRDEAIRKAVEMGQPRAGGHRLLVPDLESVRAVTADEMDAIDRSWASYCD